MKKRENEKWLNATYILKKKKGMEREEGFAMKQGETCEQWEEGVERERGRESEGWTFRRREKNYERNFLLFGLGKRFLTYFIKKNIVVQFDSISIYYFHMLFPNKSLII